MKQVTNFLFDLDGTIIESSEGIGNSIRYALAKFGLVENDKTVLESLIGPPLVASFRDHYGLSQQEATQAVDFYREYYREKGVYENRLYDGIVPLLEHLKKAGKEVFLATAKPTFFAKKILKHLNLTYLFTGIVGSNLDNTRTDKSEIIAFVLNEYQVNPLDSVMIGDTKYDMIGGKKQGLLTIGVHYGHGTKEDLTACKPDYLVNDCRELATLIEQFL